VEFDVPDRLIGEDRAHWFEEPLSEDDRENPSEHDWASSIIKDKQTPYVQHLLAGKMLSLLNQKDTKRALAATGDTRKGAEVLSGELEGAQIGPDKQYNLEEDKVFKKWVPEAFGSEDEEEEEEEDVSRFAGIEDKDLIDYIKSLEPKIVVATRKSEASLTRQIKEIEHPASRARLLRLLEQRLASESSPKKDGSEASGDGSSPSSAEVNKGALKEQP
jgi:hypothetical protein